MLLSIVLIAIIIVMDRLVKYWAMAILAPAVEIPGIQGLFHFYYVENSGAAFSILSKHTWILIVITCIVVLGALFLLFFTKTNLPIRLCLIGIIGGGIGNLIDRILYGYVIDMFKLDFMDFAVFNVADIFITVAGIAMVAILLFGKNNTIFELKKGYDTKSNSTDSE